MLILNMGIPRSGSTWAFNVFRRILEFKNLSYETSNPLNASAVNEEIASNAQDHIKILHFHDVTENVITRARSPECAAFFNIRDPRDVVVSLMQLHDAEFREAMTMAASAFMSLQLASRIPGLMLIPYDHIVDHPEALIFQMALKIGHYIAPQAAADIAEQTSIGKHQARMDYVTQNHDQPEAGIQSAFSGRRHVKFDETSLITDRHIQSGKTGRWKEELSLDHQEELNKTFSNILRQLGY